MNELMNECVLLFGCRHCAAQCEQDGAEEAAGGLDARELGAPQPAAQVAERNTAS